MGESLNGKYRVLQIAYAVFFSSMAIATVVFIALYAMGRYAPVP
jgi:hypothetical protein